MKCWLTSLLLFFGGVGCLADGTPGSDNDPLQVFEGPMYRHAQIAVSVMTLPKEIVEVDHNSEGLLVPASILKLVTTASALELLGADHRFETGLDYVGTLNDSILDGDLVIRGGGDPTLGSRYLGEPRPTFLTRWVELVKNAGIREIRGRVVADAGLFDDEPLSPYWLWEDLGNYYAAGAFGLGVHDNSYTLHLRSEAPGTRPHILGTDPPLPRLQLENRLLAAPNNKDSAYIYGVPYVWHHSLRGTLPANRTRFSIRGALPDPPLQAAILLHDALTRHGVSVRNEPATLRTYTLPQVMTTRLGVHVSPPLSRIVTIIHHNSDNVYAECLLRHLAATRFKPPYSAKQGIAVIHDHWKRQGLDTDGLIMVDGSGLSPVNRLSARFLCQLLAYMSTRSPQAETFETSLPLAGVEGTVSGFLNDTPLAGKVRLKSGTHQHVTNYAGYSYRNGIKQVVVLMVNHGDLPRQQVRKDLAECLLGH